MIGQDKRSWQAPTLGAFLLGILGDGVHLSKGIELGIVAERRMKNQSIQRYLSQ